MIVLECKTRDPGYLCKIEIGATAISVYVSTCTIKMFPRTNYESLHLVSGCWIIVSNFYLSNRGLITALVTVRRGLEVILLEIILVNL